MNKMEEKKRTELVCLKNAVGELQEFVKSFSNGNLPYFYRFLDYMQNNIDLFLRVGGKDYFSLQEVLYRNWYEANNSWIGISTFCISDEVCEESIDIYYQYAMLVRKVADYFEE